MIVPPPHDMNTELPYDEMTPTRFRAEVAAVAQRQHDQFGVLITTDRPLTNAEKHLRMAAMHAGNFGWSLVALIRWVEKTYGPDAGWNATALAQDIMVNGGNSFCEDVELPAEAAPDPTGRCAKRAGEHVNCPHDPESADGDPFAAMICSPMNPGGADRG